MYRILIFFKCETFTSVKIIYHGFFLKCETFTSVKIIYRGIVLTRFVSEGSFDGSALLLKAVKVLI